ncbi:MAG: acetamidase/formamidase family protein [Phycisphaerae bacterium]
MKQLAMDHVIYAMSAGNPPALRVSLGETFALDTLDCYSGHLRRPEDRLDGITGDWANPATGPVFIEGTKAGDIIRLDILDITVRDYAVMHTGPQAGALAHHMTARQTTIIPIRHGIVEVQPGLSLPVRAMIGVIGTAPAEQAVPTITPGEHGGNLDCRDIGAGASLYLPVNVPGALVAAGDIHAVQGDGEVCCCAAEVSGRITIRTELAAQRLPTPCVETAGELLFLASAKTLDECERAVLDKAHDFLVRGLGMDAADAARLMSLAGGLGVCQVVDPLKTMKFAFPRTVLRSLGWA